MRRCGIQTTVQWLKTKRLAIRLSEQDDAKLRKCAEQEQCSAAEIIRRAIRRYAARVLKRSVG